MLDRGVSSGATAHRRPSLSAAVRWRCHVLRHAKLSLAMRYRTVVGPTKIGSVSMKVGRLGMGMRG